MKNHLVYLFFFILSLIGSFNSTFPQQAPVADKIKKEIVKHGYNRIDNYYWMRESKNPKVLTHLKAENEYLKNILKPAAELQEKLFNEMAGRIQHTDISVSYKDNGYYYYKRYEEGKEYPVFLRKKDLEEIEEEILLNVNEMAEGHSYFDISNFGLSVSPDNKILAFGYDSIGSGVYTIIFKDLITGKWLEDKIPNTTGDPVWANDNKTVFYSIPDKLFRSFKVKKHLLSVKSEKDKLVFHEKDIGFDIYVYKSKSKKYIIIRSFSTLSLEYLVLDADKPSEDFKIIQPREKGLEYSIDHYGDRFYILTNYQAKNFRLMETSVNKTGKENWKEVIPHREDARIFSIEVFKDYLAVEEFKNGIKEINVIDLINSTSHYMKFEEEVYSAYISNAHISINLDFETEWLRYRYSSLTTPGSIYEYNMRTGEKKLLKQRKISGAFDPLAFESRRFYATSKDGKRVPVSIVYKKGLVLNGENPLLLTGYGAYGGYEDLSFSTDRISLLDRGFIFAIAHVRGGEELGREWYEDGKLLNKKNTFTDFIACAEHLIKEGYTRPDKLFAQGQSMGGLMMCTVVNMRPDLFKGIIANVPFADVLTSMLDKSLPLTSTEYDELGNPNKKEYHDYMLSYSPYDNIEVKKYPSILVTTGLNDFYWHGAKFVAKLRDLKTDSNPVLLYTNLSAGHDGASGRFEAIRETALEYTFLLQLLGIMQ